MKNEYGSIERWLNECFRDSPLQSELAKKLGVIDDCETVIKAIFSPKRKAKKVSRGFATKGGK